MAPPLEDAETPNEGEEGDAEELGEKSGCGSPASRLLSGGTDAAPVNANTVVSQGADWGAVSPGVARPEEEQWPGLNVGGGGLGHAASQLCPPYGNP